ncbi:TetR/AcrR family transcriptional regulator [Cellulomonas sp. PhB143]|uniref:TetR/AcrR family transcriptional regulator n=1 Tax=Cellulomonas sp. PhB143 TaxID=2485186 RepID=UPI000F4A6AD8|nr:TetR/AcrR family transcriptional regulator [Cellulomonas sp. PhB143]ROS78794.1 TetR family transcriptional regulator [Cellulomonas sp. PhB143]
MTRMPIEERRAQLLDAALSLAAREGVEAVTIRGVAHEAQVSLGVVHYCFDGKDDLLQAMGRSMALVASEHVVGALQTEGDLTVVAHALADALWTGLQPRRHMRLLTFEFATAGVRSMALRAVAQEHLEQTWAMTSAILERLAVVGSVQFPLGFAMLSRLVAGYIDGIEIAWLVDQDDDAALASFHALADYVLSLAQPLDPA